MKRLCKKTTQINIVKIRELHTIPLKTFNFNGMKKLLLPIIFVMVGFATIYAQSSGSSSNYNDDKNAFSVQILKHALGVDYERTIVKNFGLGLSVGLAGAEIEAKYHLKPQINTASFGFSTGYTWYSYDDFTDGKSTWTASRINMFFFEYRLQKHLAFTGGLGWFDYNDKARLRTRLGIGYYFTW
jgi:hypothetical protein